MSETPFARMAPEKRDALVTAAAREFAAHPAAEASLNRIIAACGMSKSSFYHVIDSKDELLGIVVTTLTERAIEDWRPPRPEDFAVDFWSVAESMWDGAMRSWPESEALGLLWRIVWAEPRHPSVEGFHAAVDEWLSAVLDVGRRTEAVDAGAPAELQAVALMSLLRGFDRWSLALIDDSPTQSGVPAAEGGDSAEERGNPSAGTGQSMSSAEVAALANQQFRLVRRILEA